MTHAPGVVLLTDNLMVASRFQAVTARPEAVVVTANPAKVGDAAWVFVDLNAHVEERIAVVSGLREKSPQVRIIGFCHHESHDVRRRAMVAGAEQVVTNGGLQSVVMRLGLGASAAGEPQGRVAT